MISEIKDDIAAGKLYQSTHLTEPGLDAFPKALLESAEWGTDATLATTLISSGYFKQTFQRRTPKGGYTEVRVPHTAADTLAEGQFNLYYMRALCIFAIENGYAQVQYLRAKSVENPRWETEQMIGTTVDPSELLAYLRDIDWASDASSFPKPNSGLSICLINIASLAG